MIHADDRGYYGAPIGSAPIPAGESTNVVVPIDTTSAGTTIHAMLHTDAALDTLEFPGADISVFGTDGRVLNKPFLLLPTDPTQELIISVALDEFYAMMPSTLPARIIVTFSVTNHGMHPHNLEIEGEGVELLLFETDLAPGETRTVQAELPPGEYEVYCPVDDHADFGMRYMVPVEAIAMPPGAAGGELTPAPEEAATEEISAEGEATPAEETPAEAQSLTVQVQAIAVVSTVLIDSVTAVSPSWVVIHADASGASGEVVGWAPVQPGTSTSVAVQIQNDLVTAALHKMLHIDAGTMGTYEFPGADVPAADSSGNVITLPFAVLEGEAPTGGETGATLDGKALVDERCTVCHTCERIDAQDKDEAGWTATVDQMIANGAQLNVEERQAVIDYLGCHTLACSIASQGRASV